MRNHAVVGSGTGTSYSLLVALTLATIAFSAYHSIGLGLSESRNLLARERSAAALEKLDAVEDAASAVHAPATHALATRDAVMERARRDQAITDFRQAIRVARTTVANQPDVVAALQLTDRQMQSLIALSDRVLDVVASGEPTVPDETIARMGDAYARVRETLHQASALERAREAVAFRQEAARKQLLARQQMLSALLMGILVLGLFAHGRRLRGAVLTAKEREEYVLSLTRKKEELRVAIADRDARAAELTRNQSLMIEAQRLARIGAWQWDISTGTVSWSDELFQLFGLSRDQVEPSYEGYMERIAPEDRDRVAARIGQTLGDHLPFDHEYGVIMPDGQTAVHRSSGRLELDSAGNPSRMFGVSQDVTERARSEEQLLRQEAQLAEAQRIARVGSWQLEIATGDVTWSDELHSILGYASGDTRPSFKAYMSLIANDERRRVYALLETALATANEFEFEHSLTRHDGVEISILVQGVIFRDSANRPVRVLGISQDITERLKSEMQLRLSEERFKLVSRATNDLIWDRDLTSPTVWVNESFTTRLGYPQSGDIDAGLFRGGIHPDDRPRVLASLSEALVGDASEWTSQYRFRSYDGEWRDVLDRGHIVRDRSGKAMRILGAMMDISERRAIERMKDEFISTVSHELRTPLTSIRGALGLLSSGRLGALPEKGQRLLEIASSNTDRLVRLINDILDIERIESGSVSLTKVRGDAATMAQSAADMVRGLADRDGITIEVDALPTPVVADADRIVQTLTNLLGNAVKFSAPQSTVRIRVRSEAENVTFEVIDQGRGIPADKIASIFERFQQVDASDSRDKGGSGLGLTISRSIVRQHGGEIRVESEVGQGSTFTVSIPHGIALVKPLALEAKKSIYVCDDDPDAQRVLDYFLTTRGYDVTCISTGQALLEAVDARRPDAILLDLFMPGLNGWQTLAQLRSNPATAAIPVIVVSILTPHSPSPELELSGWVRKPFHEKDLAEAIDRAFHGSARRPRLMLVEDDDDLAAIIIQSLERYGIETIHARNGEQAISLADATQPDLMILDLILPGIDGFGVVDWLKDHSRWRGLPLVVYSATEPSPSQRERLQLGPTEFMTKSRVSPEEFERRIVRLLDTMTGTGRLIHDVA
jgi:PAS domain S-box-containing protein